MTADRHRNSLRVLIAILIALSLLVGCATPFEQGLEAARKGDANSQFWVGAHYHDGIDVPQDYAKAAHWLGLAADQGHVQAQTSLGILYALGTGVEQDPGRARHYFELAAERGDAAAQYNLAGIYARGMGVEQNWPEAARLARLAAEQNYGKALGYLGHLYYEGLGVERDYGEALRWYRISVEEGIDVALPGYAMALWQNDRQVEAIEAGREGVRRLPGSLRAHLALANILGDTGHHGEGIAVLERAMEIDARNPSVLNNLAWLLVTASEPQLRDPERALELVELAIEYSDVPSADTLDTLAEAQFSLGNTDLAIEAIQRALAADPSPESERIMREHLEKYEAAAAQP